MRVFTLVGVLIMALSLNGCVSVQPRCIDNVCSIFEEYPSWYRAAKKAEKKWGVPVAVQMAIIHQESSFNAKAKPPRRWILGIIPWTRPSSAYGYAQVKDETWDLYKSKTTRYFVSRTNFSDSADFVGWYGDLARSKVGIAPNNAFDLYLAYHEGLGGYAKQTYRQKPWLVTVARKVAARAQRFESQMRRYPG